MEISPINKPSLSGFVRAKVLRVDDFELSGSILLYVPKLMPNFYSDPETETVGIDMIDDSLWVTKGGGEKPTGTPATSNGIWAKPSFYLSAMEDAESSAIISEGTYDVPKIGTWVYVFFEDEDPKKCRWLPFSPFTGKFGVPLRNAVDSEATKSDAAKKPNIDVIKEYNNGTILAYDQNPEVNSFLIRFENGHTLRITDNPDSTRMDLISENRNLVTIDDGVDDITVIAHHDVNIHSDNDVRIHVGNNAEIEVVNDANIKVGKNAHFQTGKETTFKVGSNAVIDAGDNASIKAGANVDIKAGGKAAIQSSSTIDVKSGIVNIGGIVNLAMGPGGASPASAPSTSAVSVTDTVSTTEGDDATTTLSAQIFSYSHEEPDEPMTNDRVSEGVAMGYFTYEEVAMVPKEKNIPDETVPTPVQAAEPTPIDEAERVDDTCFEISPSYTICDVSSNAVVTKNKIAAQVGLSAADIQDNLANIAQSCLEPIKAKYPDMIVTSGFRTGSGTSQHYKGEAIDMQFPSHKPREYYEMAQWIRDNVPFDQLLLEYKTTGTKLPWIHISLKRTTNRSMLMTFNNHRRYRDIGVLYNLG